VKENVHFNREAWGEAALILNWHEGNIPRWRSGPVVAS